MHLILSLSTFTILWSTVYALPASHAQSLRGPDLGSPRKRCGPVASYYGQTPADYNKYNTDAWLDNWWQNASSLVKTNSAGFAGAFGQWSIGNPDWSCRDDGSSSDCDFVPCDNRVLNNLGSSTRQAYYVIESVNRLHSYFMGLSQSFEVSAIATALSKDSWAMTFYRDKDDKSALILREVLNGVNMVVGIGAAFAGLAGPAAGVASGVVATLFGAAAGAAGPLVGTHQDDTLKRSADLGAILAKVVVDSMKAFTSANNALMRGDNYLNTGDIRSYLKGGLFVNFGGVDKNAIIDAMNALLIGQAINQLYRTQKIFIMGGGACGDNQGIGSGPADYGICRDGKAWYLYYWQENDVISLTSHRWGWTAVPPGADQLGQGDYANVKVSDVINSSLDAYNVAGYAYNSSTAYARVQSALQDQWANPGAQGPSWEGTFTIPVCDVSAAITDPNVEQKQYILQPYGHGMRPHWCGPICSGNIQTTRDFINTANMHNFKSPKHMCNHDPGY